MIDRQIDDRYKHMHMYEIFSHIYMYIHTHVLIGDIFGPDFLLANYF